MLKPPLASTLSSSGSSHTTGSHASAFFTFEKQAASLSDLGIVRRIVEREGCVEALAQLLTTKSKAKSDALSTTSEIDQVYPYTYPRRGTLGNGTSSKSSTASPMVIQSLLDQLRTVSVQIVEAIEQWRETTQLQVFQWRQLNYLLKMTADLDFLAAAAVHVDALAQLPRLERNPFLASLHLDHAALREKTPDAAIALGVFVGNVDMKRVFYASKVLLRELETERKRQLMQQQTGSSDEDNDGGDGDNVGALSSAMAVVDPSLLTAHKHQPSMRVRWSNQDVKAPQSLSASMSSLPHATYSSLGNNTSELQPRDRKEEMSRDLELSRELIFHAEHELGAIREEVAILQEKLADSLARPERRRKLQNKIGALINALKFKSGDLYQRKNELRRKEAVFRLVCERSSGHQPHVYLSAVESAMQEDELRRQDIVERFATLAKIRAASMSSTSRHKHKQQQQHLASHASPTFKSAFNGHSSSSQERSHSGHQRSFQDMTSDDVARFLDSLDLGCSYGTRFKAQGIDGALLLQATEQDLEEIGVALRLHRVRMLEAIDRVQPRLET